MKPKIGRKQPTVPKLGGSSLSLLKMRRTMIYVPNPSTDLKGHASQNEYAQVGATVPPSNSNSQSQENGLHQIGENGLFQIGEDEQDNNSSSLSSESDLAESPAGQTIRSSYKSPIFDQHHLEPCPVNGCPLNPQSRVMNDFCCIL